MPRRKNGERPYPGTPKTVFLGPYLGQFSGYSRQHTDVTGATYHVCCMLLYNITTLTVILLNRNPNNRFIHLLVGAIR